MKNRFYLIGLLFAWCLVMQAQESVSAELNQINKEIQPVTGWSWEGGVGLMVGGSDFTDNWITGTQLTLAKRYTLKAGQLVSGGLTYRTLDISTTVKGLYAQASLGQDFRIKERGFSIQVSGGYPITQSATNDEVRFDKGWYVEPKLAYYCKLGDHMAQLSLGLYTSQISNELVLDDFERYQDWSIRRTSMALTVLF